MATRVQLADMHTGKPKFIEVGDYTYGHRGIKIANSHDAELKIGKFCSIGWGVQVFLGGQHRTNFFSTYPFGYLHTDKFPDYPEINVQQGKDVGTTKGNVIIGNDVWIGANVTILSGVRIGNGAVISANSTVFKDVKPYSINGGNPCEFWTYRFSKEKIEKLLEIEWWKWSEEHIKNIVNFICSDDKFNKIVEYYEKNIL